MLAGCGIEESELLWLIDDKGSFLFGRPNEDTPPLRGPKQDCLLKWLDKEDVSSGALGYEGAQ